MRQHPGRRQALVDHLRRYGCLGQRFAVIADPLATDVTLDADRARGVVQLLGHIFANALERAATAAGRRFGFVVNVGARQVRRNRRPFGLALLRILGRRAELLEFLLDRGDIRRTGFVEQLICSADSLSA